MRSLARLAFASLLGLLVSGAGYRYLRPLVSPSRASPSRPSRTVPLTPEERARARRLVRFLEDEQDKVQAIKGHEIVSMLNARGLDERSVLDLEHGVWVAPIASEAPAAVTSSP